MLRLIFNDKFLEKVSNRITQVIMERLNLIESNLDKELKSIRFDIKRLDEKLTQQNLKTTQEYGMLKYQIQNLEKKKRTKERELNSH